MPKNPSRKSKSSRRNSQAGPTRPALEPSQARRQAEPRRSEAERPPIAPTVMAAPTAPPIAMPAAWGLVLQPAERTAQQINDTVARTDQAMREFQRQVTDDLTQTIDLMGTASLVPLHLVGAWSRAWSAWIRNVSNA